MREGKHVGINKYETEMRCDDDEREERNGTLLAPFFK